MKKLLIIITIVTLGVLLVGCTKEETESDALKFKAEYEELNGKPNSTGTKNYVTLDISESNTIKYRTESEIIELLESGTGIIYFGFPNCPWCRNATYALLEIAEEEKMDVNYLNILDIRSTYSIEEDGRLTLEKEGTESYYRILELLDNELEDFTLTTESGLEVSTGEKRLYSPTTVFVKDGIIEGVHVGTVSSQEDPYVLLTDEQKEELKEIFMNYINKIK